MKKIFSKLIVGVLALCVLFTGLVACGGTSWSGTDLTDGGKVLSQGGFVAETEKYLYFLNGIADSTADNSFGAPLKGALMAVDKSDLSKKPVVAVPKLFAATDYNGGIFISGGYVYYGTPNVEKDSSGAVANSEMTFMRTKLDGSGTTENFFTVGALSTEYRFIEKDGAVYLVYYDANETALIGYNTSDKTSTVIAKTDEEAEKYSLGSYKFMSGDDAEGVVIYTVTVYKYAYDADKAEDYNTNRKASYNQVYMYKAGDEVAEGAGIAGTLVLDGSCGTVDNIDDDYTYELTMVDAGYVFYKETEVTQSSDSTTYGATAAELVAGDKGTKIVNTDYVSSSNIIKALGEVYTLSDGKIYRSTMTKKDHAIKECVAVCDTIGTLLFVKDNYVYYYNSDNQLAKLELGNDKANEIRISEDTVATTWYDPQFVALGGTEYLFYCDNSSYGVSYVKYIDLSATVKDEDTDEDGKADLYYLDTEKIGFIGEMTASDKASVVTAKINAVTNGLSGGNLVFEEKEDGTLFVESFDEAEAAYNAASDEVKNLIEENTVDTLNDYKEAIRIANLYVKLKGIEKYDEDAGAEAAAEEFKTVYDSIKEDIEAFLDTEDVEKINGYIENNLKYYYQQAVKFFEAETDAE